MSSKHIVLVWPSGDVVCEGYSVFGGEPEASDASDQEEIRETTRSSEDASGIFMTREASGPSSRAA